MAKFFQRKRAKKRAIAVLAVTLATTLSLGALAACADDPTTTEPEEETLSRTDTQLIPNGNFEFYSDSEETELSKKVNLISTPNNWTNGYGSALGSSAPSSDAKSGIVNTAEWENFTKPGRPFSSKEDALANWEAEGVTAYDRIKAYDDFDIDSTDDFEYYDDYKYTIDYDDIKNFYNTETNEYKVKNPELHVGAAENGGSSVLMIQNKKVTSQVWGTAQHYTSSNTLTVAAGTAVKLSVWVKTSNLFHLEEKETKEGAGAFIGVTSSVGGTTLDQMQIKNINTESEKQKTACDANGWIEYTLYVRASSFATSTVQVSLGLGMGSSAETNELVDGYAFFDDLTCTVIKSEEYDQLASGLPTIKIENLNDGNFKPHADADIAAGQKVFALDLQKSTTALNNLTATSIDLTTEEANGQTYSPNTYPQVMLGHDATNSVPEFTTLKGLNDNPKVLPSVKADFEKYPFKTVGVEKDDQQVLLLMSYNGAPYTAKVSDNRFQLAKDENMLVSFFVKTSDMKGCSGAGVTLVDGSNKTAITPFDSNTVSAVDIKNQTSTEKDIFDGWVRCSFIISNDTKDNKTFSLEFTYGSTTITGTTKDNYIAGYAAFTNVEMSKLSDREASYATTGTYAQKVALTDDDKVDGQKFDSTVTNDKAIETNLARTANYWGVTGGNERVGGTDKTAPDTTPTDVYAGLINKEHASEYTSAPWATTVGLTSSNWSTVFGNATQPLVIANEAEAGASYGFIALNDTTVATDGAQRISVDVKVSANAKAYVYLIDTSNLDDGYSKNLALGVPNVTYWYDDEGNVTTKDPADKDFSYRTDVAYNLNENGLYTNAKDGNDNAYYANLANYAADANGNLVTKDGEIAFYAKDGKFYAYYDGTNYSTEVKDFDRTIARYNYADAAKPEAVIEVNGADTAGKWVNVSFSIKAGNEAKKFRIEVWSGTRDGAEEGKNPKGSYVLFNNLLSESIEDFDGLVKEAKDALGDEPSADVLRDYTFTFYDSPSYLRYDATQDTEEEGNPYDGYVQSEKTEGVAYVYWKDVAASKQNYRKFFNYSLSEVTVEKSTTDDTTEEETEEETETNPADILLLASSIALVAALAIVIVSIFVQKAVKKHRKNNPRIKVVKDKKEKAPKKEKPAKAKKTDDTPVDENDPYNE